MTKKNGLQSMQNNEKNDIDNTKMMITKYVNVPLMERLDQYLDEIKNIIKKVFLFIYGRCNICFGFVSHG